jgi:hypothetical protein
MRAALSAFGGCVARVLQKSARYCARTSTRASARARSTGPCIGGVVEQRQSRRQGTRELKPTGYLFPSLCFLPSVALLGFFHERNRPLPRLRVFPWLPAWALEEVGSAASRQTPLPRPAR